MLQITPRIAAALTHLIAVIDGDSKPHPDWVDAVCTARAALPTETVKALESAASPSHGAHDIVMLPILHDDLDRACEAPDLQGHVRQEHHHFEHHEPRSAGRARGGSRLREAVR